MTSKVMKPGTPGAILGNKRAKQQTIEELMGEFVAEDLLVGIENTSVASPGLPAFSIGKAESEPDLKPAKGILLRDGVRSVVPLNCGNLGSKRVKFSNEVD
jgi:hypothetical protein